MPYDPKTGLWIPEDDSVAGKLNTLTSGSSPYITQARATAARTANKRGLLNSSIAAGAGEVAAINSAIPIASQDAAQVYGKNMSQLSADNSLRSQSQGETAARSNLEYQTGATASLSAQDAAQQLAAQREAATSNRSNLEYQTGATSSLSAQEAAQQGGLLDKSSAAAAALARQNAEDQLKYGTTLADRQAAAASSLSAQEANQQGGLLSQSSAAAAALARQNAEDQLKYGTTLADRQASAAAALSAQEANQQGGLLSQSNAAAASLSAQNAGQQLTYGTTLSDRENAASMARQEAATAADRANLEYSTGANSSALDKQLAATRDNTVFTTNAQSADNAAARAADQQKATLAATLQTNDQYLTSFASLFNNPDIPAATRASYQAVLDNVRSSNLALTEVINNVSLNWGAGQAAIQEVSSQGSYSDPRVQQAAA